MKKISFKVAEEDIRAIAKNTLTLVISRLGINFQQNIANIEQAFLSANNMEILTEIQTLIDGLEDNIKELQNLADLVGEIPDLDSKEE